MRVKIPFRELSLSIKHDTLYLVSSNDDRTASRREPYWKLANRESSRAGDALEAAMIQCGLISLRGFARRVRDELPEAATFQMETRTIAPGGWHFVGLFDSEGRSIHKDTEAFASLIDDDAVHFPPMLRIDYLPKDAVEKLPPPGGWSISVVGLLELPVEQVHQAIALKGLTDDEFTAASRVAREHLDLVGVVRTRRDIVDQIRKAGDLRSGMTEGQIELAGGRSTRGIS